MFVRLMFIGCWFLFTSSVALASINFEGADWIWGREGGRDLQGFQGGQVLFRAELELPDPSQIASAEVIVTADNLYALYLNGHGVGASPVNNDAWRNAGRFDLADQLRGGRNVFALRAVNTLPGPAGVILKAEVRLKDGRLITLASNAAWHCTRKEEANWTLLAFEDGTWSPVRVLGALGRGPWNVVTIPREARAVAEVDPAVARKAAEVLKNARRNRTAPQRAVNSNAIVEQPAGPDFSWPDAIVYLGEDCSLYRPKGPRKPSAADSLAVTIFNTGNSRAFPEHDLPAPMKMGRKLMMVRPGPSAEKARVLFDAGKGAIGSPTVSFDGKTIFMSMAAEGSDFFHLYRVPAEGGMPVKLTDGPFHDIDPAELPDGRIVFSSTRIGTFEEYHSPPSRALFVMNPDGTEIRPLTYTPIFDNEPEVMADGRILLIRSDNFFDRGKVETTLHSIRPDGCAGQTEFGLENLPEYGNRLRAFYCGSPAPLEDGQVAYLSHGSIVLGRPGTAASSHRHFRMVAGDVAALPDGRLLCTRGRVVTVKPASEGQKAVQDVRYREIGILDPQQIPPRFTVLHTIPEGGLHSPLFLGPRKRPPQLVDLVDAAADENVDATGFLFCSDARFSGNTTAGWPHVRAVRLFAAKPLTLRSSHSYIVHAGTEVAELGTVPLAPDGSFHVEVPANTPLAMQLVDGEGRSELNEMSWLYVRPGEQRSCTGCHQPRQEAPRFSARLPMALSRPPLKLTEMAGTHRYRGNNAAVNGLMELQFDRFREVAGLNRHPAAEELRSGKEELQDAITLLEKGKRQEKIASAQRLAIFRDPQAAPGLAKLLESGDRELSVAAAMALASCGNRDSIPPLINAMEHEAPSVVQAAILAIENLSGYQAVCDPYAPMKSRRAAVDACRTWFAQRRWGEIEADLLQRLHSGDRDVVRRAAVALGHTGGNAARRALQRYVREHRDDNPYPAWRKAGHRGDQARFHAESPVNPRTLQAATRSLGYLQDVAAIPLLEETVMQHRDPNTGNIFLAEAAIEAIGLMDSPDADAALIRILGALQPYPNYTEWYGDHPALKACHASPLHYFILEALDRHEVSGSPEVVPLLIQSLPIDPDRALFLTTDDYEELVGRILRRNGEEAAVVETCLALLGELDARALPRYKQAMASAPRCWAGNPGPENRAAQVLSLACRDGHYEPRIRSALLRYEKVDDGIQRVFHTGIPVVQRLPRKHWVCFYLARTLGYLGQESSVDPLIHLLGTTPAEAADGRPDPQGPGVLFLHNDLTPCWRAAVAWALGKIGDTRAVPVLLDVIRDFEQAPDTRHAAVEALGLIGDPGSLKSIQKLVEDYPEVAGKRSLLRLGNIAMGSKGL